MPNVSVVHIVLANTGGLMILAISGMVFPSQDPETRIGQVISSASWIALNDMPLVEQGKQTVLSRIANEEWEAPFVWTIQWENVPAQEAKQWVTAELLQSSGAL